MMNGVFMNKGFDVEKLGNSKKQAEDLKEICIKHSVSYEDLNKMLDSEKVKKLLNRYCSLMLFSTNFRCFSRAFSSGSVCKYS